jgi:hypothetical protein
VIKGDPSSFIQLSGAMPLPPPPPPPVESGHSDDTRIRRATLADESFHLDASSAAPQAEPEAVRDR